MTSESTPSESSLRKYALVAAPLVVFAVVAWLAELALRHAAGAESAAQLAPGLAGVVSGLLTVRLARDSSDRDEDEAPLPAPHRPAGPPAERPVSATTRALWILAAGLGFAACDFVAWVVGVGSVVVAPVDAVTAAAWFDATSRRSIVVFAVLALVVAYSVSLRLREGTARAFAIAIGLYVVVNSAQNLALGGEIDSQWIAWTFGYVLTVAAACCVGDAVARRRRAAFDAARAARAAVRRGH